MMWGIPLPNFLLLLVHLVCSPLAVKSWHRGIFRTLGGIVIIWTAVRSYLATEVNAWKFIMPRRSNMRILPLLAIVYILCWFLCVLCWGMML